MVMVGWFTGDCRELFSRVIFTTWLIIGEYERNINGIPLNLAVEWGWDRGIFHDTLERINNKQFCCQIPLDIPAEEFQPKFDTHYCNMFDVFSDYMFFFPMAK